MKEVRLDNLETEDITVGFSRDLMEKVRQAGRLSKNIKEAMTTLNKVKKTAIKDLLETNEKIEELLNTMEVIEEED